MINSIVKRHDKLNPFTDTQINVIRSATKLFLQNGYTETTLKMIEQDSGVKVGNITYYFHSKEDLLIVLIEELIDYHTIMLENICDKEGDKLFAYAMEITAQIALCEHNRSAWDLYYSAYNLPQTYEIIKAWAAEKTYNLLGEMLPDWTERDFKEVEEVASGIELAALKSVCSRNFTLDKKISIFLNSIMMLYHVPEDERKAIIDRILGCNYEDIANEMFGGFVARLDNN